jgi:acetyl esterase
VRDSREFEVAAQVLIYPATDSSKQYPSKEAFAEGYLLTKNMMDWFTRHYMRSPEDLVNPLFSPLLTPDLNNLPPTFVITAGYDPLKDEGIAYAEALKAAGATVLHINYPNLIHGFITFPLLSREAFGAFDDIRKFIENQAL